MAVFATETEVRLLVQIDDTVVASAALVEASIATAHERVLADLGVAVDLVDPPAAVRQGEVLFAAAALMQSLASRDAVEQVELQIGGQRIDAGQKFASLMSMARRFEKEAMSMLGPYTERPGMGAPGDVTATTPVLGG